MYFGLLACKVRSLPFQWWTLRYSTWVSSALTHSIDIFPLVRERTEIIFNFFGSLLQLWPHINSTLKNALAYFGAAAATKKKEINLVETRRHRRASLKSSRRWSNGPRDSWSWSSGRRPRSRRRGPAAPPGRCREGRTWPCWPRRTGRTSQSPGIGVLKVFSSSLTQRG